MRCARDTWTPVWGCKERPGSLAGGEDLSHLIQLQSFHIYCLMTHSALPLGEKPIPTIIGNFLLGGLYLAQYYLQYIPENVVGLTGADSMNLFRLLISFDFFALAVLHLIAYLRKEKE